MNRVLLTGRLTRDPETRTVGRPPVGRALPAPGALFRRRPDDQKRASGVGTYFGGAVTRPHLAM